MGSPASSVIVSTDQISQVIWYVHIADTEITVVESFIDFIQLHGKSAVIKTDLWQATTLRWRTATAKDTAMPQLWLDKLVVYNVFWL